MTREGNDMSNQDRVKAAFAKGFYDGVLGVGLDTTKQVADTYPEFDDAETDAYLGGVEDGRAGDRWRLDA
jgi:hypothetical protein